MSRTHVQHVRLLYKTILRLHRGLPEELQSLGNSYARDEFKRHKSCNPAEASIFMTEWANYAVQLSQQLGLRGPTTGRQLGSNLGEDALEQLRDDQIQQLYDLLTAATAPAESNK